MLDLFTNTKIRSMSIIKKLVKEKLNQLSKVKKNCLNNDGLELPDNVNISRSDISSIESIKWYERSEYPKTYKECCDVLGTLNDCHLTLELDTPAAYDLSVDKEFDYIDELEKLRKLFICRNAYWKIAGEQMGLGKPWEPDWTTNCAKYVIRTRQNNIVREFSDKYNDFLAFPIAEMRDAFYENFKELIEICKKLL